MESVAQVRQIIVQILLKFLSTNEIKPCAYIFDEKHCRSEKKKKVQTFTRMLEVSTVDTFFDNDATSLVEILDAHNRFLYLLYNLLVLSFLPL